MPLLRLEVFTNDACAAQGENPAAESATREADRIAAYNQGFEAGRQEEALSRDESERRLRAEVAASLEALSFTWEEARARLLAALEPLMTAITGQLLPEMARRVLAPTVLAQLMPLAGACVDKPLDLVVHPAARGPVEELLRGTVRLPLRIVDGPEQREGQVTLDFGDAGTRIDLTRALAEITAAMDAFFAMTREDSADG